MKDNTRKYLKQESKYCDEIWNECYENGDNTLGHFHICDFELLAMINRYKYSYRKFCKEWDKMCKKYLASIGQEKDENLECCEHCPHNRYLTFSQEDNYFLNIAGLSSEDFLFEEEKEIK